MIAANESAKQLFEMKSDINDAFPIHPAADKLWHAFLKKAFTHSGESTTRLELIADKNLYLRARCIGEDVLLVSFEDDSEKRIAYEAVRKSLAQYRQIIETIPAITYISTIRDKENLLFISPQVAQILGYPRESMFDPCQPFWQKYLYPEDKERVLIARRTAIEELKDFSLEYRMVSARGEAIWFYDEAKVARDESAMPVFFQGFLINITEKRRALIELENREEHFRSLIENISDVIAILNERGSIQYVSSSVYRSLGYAPDELERRNVKDLVYPPDLILLQRTLAGLKTDENASFNLELSLMAKDGQVRLFEVFVKNLIADSVSQGIVINANDITERKQTEERLTALATFPEQNPDPVIEIDSEGRPTYLNPAAEERFPGFRDNPFRHPVFRGMKEILQQMQNEPQKTVTRETEYQGYIYIQRIVVVEGSGVMRVYFSDITQRKEMEREKERQNNFLRSILDSLPYPFLIIDPKTLDVRMMNVACSANNPNTTIKCFDAMSEHKEMCHRDETCSVKRILELKKPVYTEWVNEDKDKQKRWIEVSAYPIFNRSGEIEAVVEYFIDSTERKHNELERLMLSTALEQISNAVIITDPKGSIEYINTAFESVTGYKLKEVVGKNPRILKTNYQPKSFYSELWKTLTAGKTWNGEFLNRRKNGATYWANTTITPIRNAQGEIENLIGIQEDVTERKKAEAELLKAKEAAEGSNRLKSQFLANISHELRTPLNSILGFTEVLLGDENDKERLETLRIIQSSGKRLLDLINDILDLSRMETGKAEIFPAPFTFRSILESVYSRFYTAAFDKGVEFSVECEDTFPEVVVGDEKKIHRIIENLVDNAVKFTKTGSIRIHCSYLEGIGTIQVADTGVGIEPDKLDTVFSPFVQGDGSITRAYDGNGVGLALCRKTADILKGDITVDSILGQGSTFTVTLPMPLADEDNPDEDIAISGDAMVQRWLSHNPDHPELKQLVLETLETLPEKALALKNASIHQDFETLQKLVNELRGVWGNLGMKELYNEVLHLNDEMKQTPSDIHRIKMLIYGLEKIIWNIPKTYFNPHLFADKDFKERLKHTRALIVDDNDIDRQLMRSMLKRMKIESAIAENGKAALEKLLKEKFDIVLLDSRMPVWDGIETMQQIRKKPELQAIPVIGLISSSFPNDAFSLLQNGATDYIIKPIDKNIFEYKLLSLVKTFRSDERMMRFEPIVLNLQAKRWAKDCLKRLKKNLDVFDRNDIERIAARMEKNEVLPIHPEVKITIERLKHSAENFDEAELKHAIDDLEKICGGEKND